MELAHKVPGKALASLAHVIAAVPGTNTGNMSVHMASNVCLHSGLLGDEAIQTFASYVEEYGTLGSELDEYDLVSTGTKLYTLLDVGTPRVRMLVAFKDGHRLEVDPTSKYMVFS